MLPANPNSADFHFFLRQFDNYLVIAKVEHEARLSLLLNALARDDIAIFDGLREPKATFDEARERLTEHFSDKSSVLLRRKQFFEARQQSTESISAFACRPRLLVLVDHGLQFF